MEDHVRFPLTRHFEYAHKGEVTQAQFVELNEPTTRNLSEVGLLRQGLVQALRSFQTATQDQVQQAPAEDAPPPSDTIAAEEIIAILAASSVRLEGVYEAARSLLLSDGIAKVDGQEKMNATLFAKMSARDAEMMIGTYLASFILAS